MNASEVSNLVTALKEGVVTVNFRKINTNELRIMPCTLNPTLLEENGVKVGISNFDPESDHIAAWALDKKAWRSFRLNTVEQWEVGFPSTWRDDVEMA